MNDVEKRMMYENFGEDQRIELQAGSDKGLDVSCYANPEYLAIQMRQVRLGLEAGLDVSVYNKPDYDWFQMEEIRRGMQAGISYQLYAKPSIDYRKMRQIRKGLQDGIDLSPYVKMDAGLLEEIRKAIKVRVSIVDFIKEGYAVEQLSEIRSALEKKVNIRPYISVEYRGTSIREICLGLEAGLDVTVYASLEYGWRQMREIRLGMEARVDVSQYSNALYSWQQMRELRLGLEEGLDIEQYKKFIYTAADMEKMRKKLLAEEARQIVDNTEEQQLIGELISIFISRDEMEACIEVRGDAKITETDILKKLRQNGVTQGIQKQEIKSLLEEGKFNQTIVVAKGQEPRTGKDGWYEFFFDTNPTHSPIILEDGTADFKNVKWFELVEKDQKIAEYHSAEYGRAGFTVTGKFLKAKKGKEKSVLRGPGFRVENEGKTYISNMDGRIHYDGVNRLEVSRVCILGGVNLATGNINFDGTIYIRGNVGSGVAITATENVYVDGYVEAARIQSGGEILLRKGVNGAGSGSLEAKENIAGQFFEDVRVRAGGDIIGQYSLNSYLHAESKITMVGKKGLLLGGIARASGGITAETVGNKMALRTVLNVGIDQETVKRQQKNVGDIENVKRELTILRHSQVDFQNRYAPEVRNSMEIYLKIEDAVYTKSLQLKNLLEEKEQIEAQMTEGQGAKVTVKGTLYEGAEVIIDNIKWKAFSVKDVTLRCASNKIVVE